MEITKAQGMMDLEITDEAKDNCIAFAVRLLNLLNSKKQIDQDIKALKQEFSEQGIAVNVVVKALNKLKAKKKMSQSEYFELETIGNWLETNKEVDDSLVELMSKN